MTESEWNTATSPEAMLSYLQGTGRLSGRKARLFAVACCRRIWHFLTHDESRKDVEAAEQYANGLVSYQVLKARQEAADLALWEAAWGTNCNCPAWLVRADRGAAMATVWDQVQPEAVANVAAQAVGWEAAVPHLARHDYGAWKAAVRARATEEAKVQCDLLRDLFGNPFRSLPAIGPSLLTHRVLAAAQAAYTNPLVPSGHLNPDRLAALAQFLEDAGCRDAGLLRHLRGEGPHWKGCHGVDAVLRKE
jgi:hypothetical protein